MEQYLTQTIQSLQEMKKICKIEFFEVILATTPILLTDSS